MYQHDKKESIKLIETILIAVKKRKQIENFNDLWQDCLLAVDEICKKMQIDVDTYDDVSEITQKKDILENYNSNTNEVLEYLNDLIEYIKCEIPTRLKIAFMPYKASMWDSLETIYKASINDETCDVQVIPIPYYELGDNQSLVYEGDKLSNEINITNYQEYNLEVEYPDIIFIHNIYDNYNKVTRLPEIYHTANLKACTDMLVYVPYHISSPYTHTTDQPGYAYWLPTLKYVDKVVLCGKFVEEEALEFGIPKEKILTLGSPKFDQILSSNNKSKGIPVKWQKKIEGKKVFMLNTGCMDFVNDLRSASVLLELLLDMVRYIDNLVFIWRPHPLTRASLVKFAPNNLPIYDMYTLGIDADLYNVGTILDETTNYVDTLKAADLLISGLSSITDLFGLTGKPVLFLGSEMPENCLLPREAYYYFYDDIQPWFDFIKEFVKGYDPYKDKRKDIYKSIYENLDGTSGKKIFLTIKNDILSL